MATISLVLALLLAGPGENEQQRGDPFGACCNDDGDCCMLDQTGQQVRCDGSGTMPMPMSFCIDEPPNGLGWTFAGDGSTCATAQCEPANVPTVSEWGMAVLALGVLVGGTLVFHRRETLQRG